MVLSFDIKGTPLTMLSPSDRKVIELTDDGIFKVGVEFMSWMGQKPNGANGEFVLTERLREGFAEHLSSKGYKWAFVTAFVLCGTEWSRKVD
jgi:hypothetical protein